MLGGILPLSSAKATLIMLARPEAVSQCPTFVFTDPIRRGCSGDLFSRKTEAIALASMGSPVGVPVPLEHREISLSFKQWQEKTQGISLVEFRKYAMIKTNINHIK